MSPVAMPRQLALSSVRHRPCINHSYSHVPFDSGPTQGLNGPQHFFIALMLIVGRRALPWLFWQVARTGSRELFTLSVIATAIGIAYGASALFSVSFALGAFSVLFFVSVGMLFEPSILIE